MVDLVMTSPACSLEIINQKGIAAILDLSFVVDDFRYMIPAYLAKRLLDFIPVPKFQPLPAAVKWI
jgi:hypothetical protein